MVKEADETNLRLNEVMDKESSRPYSKAGKSNSVEEVNQKIQDAFYEDTDKDDVVPTYVTNETAAIKITGDKK